MKESKFEDKRNCKNYLNYAFLRPIFLLPWVINACLHSETCKNNLKDIGKYCSGRILEEGDNYNDKNGKTSN
jgi:hypothetical protein